MLPILRVKKKGERGSHLPLHFERRLLFSVVFSGVPGIVLSLLLLWSSGYSLDHKLEGSVFVVLLWLSLSLSARDGVINSLHVLSNVVSALKDDDFSFRATKPTPGDALGELALEINSLSRAFAEERLGTLETINLLRKVMAEAETIIFAFSADNRLRIINRAGTRFLGRPEEELLNRTAGALGIEDLLDGPPSNVVSYMDSGGTEKRWIVRRAGFRQRGEPHRLIVLAEASEALRAEERIAWQRLIRVLSHEINNSLAPIRTIAHTLRRMTSNTKLPMPISEDLKHGLGVIHDRADSLGRFLQNYARLAKLPMPIKKPVAIRDLVDRVTSLESRLTLKVGPGPDVYIFVDPDQIEQVLINLIKNATDSVLLVPQADPGSEPVTISWTVNSKDLEIWVRDTGIGLTETENLFVPFYTTKPSGSGIGLLLSRQIIEAHQGSLMLRNRSDRTGCEVEIKLPRCIVEQPEPHNLVVQ
jgi:nitrogen fixation/metabolism regulation signal transduction histidine kinase